MFDVKPRQKENVFVTVFTSIQYRALSNKAADAFYKLSNTRAQIQSYVFDDHESCGRGTRKGIFLSANLD
ncbi:hypothetical protein ACB098_11G030900 [Castanea mollissima]